jgi:hypothetical protein
MNTQSVRDIATYMDSVESPSSVRALAKMHRWASGQTPSTLSVGQILERHRHPQKVTLRFLAYNAYLMPGVRIPLGRLVGEVLREGELRDGRIAEADAYEVRAKEIGRAIRGEYDVAVLSEVFEKEEKETLLTAWPQNQKPHTAQGPDNSGNLTVQSSGLFTISTDHLIRARQTHTFDEIGDKPRDSDAWANKGVLRTEIELGLPRGRLEVYSTHLFNGGGIPGARGPGPEDRLQVQLQQVAELITFFRRTHKPQNVALVVGDLNIPYEGGIRIDNWRPYEHLMSRMHSIGMVDLWEARSRVGGCATPGFTWGHLKHGASVCEVDQTDDSYCKDTESPSENMGSRIDYVFLESQKSDHGFILDTTRPRRRPFLRRQGAEGFSKIKYMSDHLGIDVTLVATPKNV